MDTTASPSVPDFPGSWVLVCTSVVGGASIMHTPTRTTRPTSMPPEVSEARHGFEHSEGLRALLIRLHEDGQSAWRRDPEVAALMQHAANKYGALARRHGLDPWEASAAAFDAMRTRSVRHADDPWAVVTRAVKITCIAEERANGLLCSVHQARRPKFSVNHDAERFSDRENPLTDYHPRFRVPAHDPYEVADSSPDVETAVARVLPAVKDCAILFQYLGWPEETARGGIEYIVARLSEVASRASAFESLRRDYHARALLDLPSHSWLSMLRIVLGNPDPHHAHTRAARGVLHRLVSGEPLSALLTDETVIADVVLSAPGGVDRGRK